MRFDAVDIDKVSALRRGLAHASPAVSSIARGLWFRSRARRSTWFDQTTLWRWLWNLNRGVGCLPRKAPDAREVQLTGRIRMRLDLSRLTDAMCYVYGPGESEVGVVASALCAPDAVVLDVGSNVGTAALFFADCVPQGRVHAFEPSPAMRRHLDTNIELSGFGNITVHPFGLAQEPRRGALKMAHAGNPGSAYFTEAPADAKDEDGNDAEVELRVLDALEGLMPRVDLIKVDVEGLEVPALRGGERTIRRHRPALVVEINSAALERFGASAAEVFALVEGWGYRTLCLHRGRFSALGDQQLRARRLYNLIAVHPEAEEQWATVQRLAASTRGSSRFTDRYVDRAVAGIRAFLASDAGC